MWPAEGTSPRRSLTPIHQLLDRIRWDPAFAKGDFAIGYYDRVAGMIVVVPFQDVYSEKGDRFAIQVVGPEGEVHSIPLHRIREVYKARLSP